jgi:BASS family bile acid:Na+ symporter
VNLVWQPLVAFAAVALAAGLRFSPKLQGYQFTAWIIAAVTVAMIFPQAFKQWGGVNLREKWLILLVVQTVMFGMGTQMSLKDFAGIARSPRGVAVGIICHFSVMPLVGLALTKVFHFEPEIAAGIILIGSCSSGLASNVMAYIARSNLALSVTITAITTLIAPIMTPFLMTRLAGTLVEVRFFDMMIEIIKMVIVPIGAALLHDYLNHASRTSRRVVFGLAAVGTLWLAVLTAGGWRVLGAHLGPAAMLAVDLLRFIAGAIVVGVAYHGITRRWPRLQTWMPIASMAGIVYFTTVTTAAGRDDLLKVGGLLFLTAALHNGAGYFFGYWLSRAAGLDKNSARSVAFEVGLQNGGMASGLAGAMGKLGTVGLAPAIFSPWMNISGSVLANYWHKRGPERQTGYHPNAGRPRG